MNEIAIWKSTNYLEHQSKKILCKNITVPRQGKIVRWKKQTFTANICFSSLFEFVARILPRVRTELL